MRHVGAQLMRTARDRLQRHPGERACRCLDHRVVGHRVARALVAVLRDAHERLLLALLLGEEGRDPPLARLRHAGGERPVDFPRRARAEGLRQCGGRKAGLGDQQAAGSVLVEPVHQPRPLAVRRRAARSTSSMPSRWRVVPEPPCTDRPIGLFSTSTSASSCSVIDLRKARVFSSSAERREAGFGWFSLSGGMRICWPVSSRSFGSARLPFTLTSPLRMMRWMWLNDSPGKRASKNRSSRMPDSSALTVTVWTAVGSGAAAGASCGGCGTDTGAAGRCRGPLGSGRRPPPKGDALGP